MIAERMRPKLKEDSVEERAGFRPGTGTRNQILDLKMVIGKNREHKNDSLLYFIDYKKAFDTVDHNIFTLNPS